MSLPKRVQSGSISPIRKSDNMKAIKDRLEQAKKDLIDAQKMKNTNRVKQLESIIKNLSGTMARNS